MASISIYEPHVQGSTSHIYEMPSIYMSVYQMPSTAATHCNTLQHTATHCNSHMMCTRSTSYPSHAIIKSITRHHHIHHTPSHTAAPDKYPPPHTTAGAHWPDKLTGRELDEDKRQQARKLHQVNFAAKRQENWMRSTQAIISRQEAEMCRRGRDVWTMWS